MPLCLWRGPGYPGNGALQRKLIRADSKREPVILSWPRRGQVDEALYEGLHLENGVYKFRRGEFFWKRIYPATGPLPGTDPAPD